MKILIIAEIKNSLMTNEFLKTKLKFSSLYCSYFGTNDANNVINVHLKCGLLHHDLLFIITTRNPRINKKFSFSPEINAFGLEHLIINNIS